MNLQIPVAEIVMDSALPLVIQAGNLFLKFGKQEDEEWEVVVPYDRNSETAFLLSYYDIYTRIAGAFLGGAEEISGSDCAKLLYCTSVLAILSLETQSSIKSRLRQALEIDAICQDKGLID